MPALFAGVYEAIKRGALNIAVGFHTAGPLMHRELQAAIAEPPIGIQLSNADVLYLQRIARRAHTAMRETIAGNFVYARDVPTIDGPVYENIQGGAPGEWQYRILYRGQVGGVRKTMPINFSSDEKLSFEEIQALIDDFLIDRDQDAKRYGVDQIEPEDAEIVPVFMYRVKY